MSGPGSDEHDRYRDWAAAYVLGALEPAERAPYERHLRTCESCQADVKDFAAMPGLLAQIDPTGPSGDPGAAARVTDLAVARADSAYARFRERNRQWRWAAMAAAAAAVSLAAIVVVDRGDEPGLPAGAVEVMIGAGSAGPTAGQATGLVRVVPRRWGTQVELDLVGLPGRDLYQLWAVDGDGAWTVAATWTSTPEGRARLTGAAAVVAATVERIVITSDDRADVVLDAAT